MTSNKRKTTKKKARKGRPSSSALALEWNLEDLAPEWASEGIERISTALDEFSDEFQARADALQSRGEKLRKDGQKRFEKRLEQVRKELRRQPVVKRAEKIRADLEQRVERNVDAASDRVLSTLGVASSSEVKKLERKIAQLNKKLRTLEKAQAA